MHGSKKRFGWMEVKWAVETKEGDRRRRSGYGNLKRKVIIFQSSQIPLHLKYVGFFFIFDKFKLFLKKD